VGPDGSEQPHAPGAPYGETWAPTISLDGRYVTFFSMNPLGQYPGNEYFIHDMQTGTTVPLMYDLNGQPVDTEEAWTQMMLSSDDRYVAFTACGDEGTSGLHPLVPTDPDPPHPPESGAACDVFRFDRTTGSYALVSNPPDGSPSDGSGAAMSPNGRYVAFYSSNPNYVADDTNGCADLFVRDMQTGTFERI